MSKEGMEGGGGRVVIYNPFLVEMLEWCHRRHSGDVTIPIQETAPRQGILNHGDPVLCLFTTRTYDVINGDKRAGISRAGITTPEDAAAGSS